MKQPHVYLSVINLLPLSRSKALRIIDRQCTFLIAFTDFYDTGNCITCCTTSPCSYNLLYLKRFQRIHQLGILPSIELSMKYPCRMLVFAHFGILSHRFPFPKVPIHLARESSPTICPRTVLTREETTSDRGRCPSTLERFSGRRSWKPRPRKRVNTRSNGQRGRQFLRTRSVKGPSGKYVGLFPRQTAWITNNTSLGGLYPRGRPIPST